MSQGSGVNPLSQMGPSIMSAGGKANGLSFEHVLQKLQVGSCLTTAADMTE